MTPDEDERMERAERIRKLRERGVGGGASVGEDPDGEDADGGDSDGGGSDGGGSDGETGRVRESLSDGVGGATGAVLPDREQMEAAIAGGSDGAAVQSTVADETRSGDGEPDVRQEAKAAIAAAKRIGTTTDADARVLEFTLGGELFCIDIAGVEEIVKRETITRVPNTPEYVAGVVDLRGQITTILDAKCLLDIEDEGPESLVVVFAPDAFDDQGAIGWIVDEVRQVRPISEDEVRDAHSDDEYVEGILDVAETDELVVWVSPEDAIQSAIGTAEEV